MDYFNKIIKILLIMKRRVFNHCECEVALHTTSHIHHILGAFLQFLVLTPVGVGWFYGLKIALELSSWDQSYSMFEAL